MTDSAINLRLIYVEDNATIRQRVAEVLRANGFSVEEVKTAADARRIFAGENFDLMLLDILLPDGNGIDLLRELRHGKNADVPVIILSALGEEIDQRISGLDAGANDYLAKPFSTRELIARIRAVMRSIPPRAGTMPAVPVTIRLNGAFLDLQQPWIFRDDGTQILLSMKEFCLLRYFAENAGKIVDVKEIINNVWGLNPNTTSTASPIVFISRLRKKLEGLCEIKSVRGTGYKFELTGGNAA
ncbi:MAG: response regulator transcription factor [Opitutales bacterium]|nr:response regulator transcription factor [Opitutales bacterium]